MEEEVNSLRQVVGIMDHGLLDLINRRVRLTGHIVEIKARSSLPCRDRQREEDLYLRISLSNDGPLSDTGAQRIFEILTAESRRLQQSLSAPRPHSPGTGIMQTIIIQGGIGSYSERAARVLLGPAVAIYYHDSFDEALADYRRHRGSGLLLPWWNHCIGPIHDVQRRIHQYGLTSRASLLLPVRHCLIGYRGMNLDAGGDVSSHPAALAQCGRFFQANPQLRPRPTSDTGDSVVALARGKRRQAFAIASREAAAAHGMHIIRSDIGDRPDNQTLFRFYGTSE